MLTMDDMEEPVLFIKEDDRGKLTINPEAVTILRKIDKPIVSVAIVGKYRTGKSYLMNQLYGESRGFGMGDTVQSCTKGFWIWCRPHPLDPEKYVVLLDTEGLDDVEQDSTHDVKVFSLAILLSSCLVYNSLGTIDNDAIKRLHFVTELTEHIRVQSDVEENGNNFDSFFPSFIWVVRDFILTMSIEGKKCTEDEYLEHALKLKTGFGATISNFNAPRECIRDFFRHRKCFVLCAPIHDSTQLQRLDQLSSSELKPEFVANLENIRAFIYKETKQFGQFETSINGPRFLFLAEKYLEKINGGAVPCIGNAFQMMKEHECNKALTTALDVFHKEVDKLVKPILPMALDEFYSVTHEAKELAITVYQQNALFDSSGEFHKKLLANMDEEGKYYAKMNEEKSTTYCSRIVSELYKPLERKINAGCYNKPGGYADYREDFNRLVVSYETTSNKGPCAETVMDEFLQQKQSVSKMISDNDEALSDRDRMIAENQEQLKQAERARAANDEETKILQQELLNNQISVSFMRQSRKEEFEERVKKIREYNTHMLEAREREHARLLQEGMLSQAKVYEDALLEARAAEDAFREQYLKRREEIQEACERQDKLIEEIKEKGKNRQALMMIAKGIGIAGITGLQLYLFGPAAAALTCAQFLMQTLHE